MAEPWTVLARVSNASPRAPKFVTFSMEDCARVETGSPIDIPMIPQKHTLRKRLPMVF